MSRYIHTYLPTYFRARARVRAFSLSPTHSHTSGDDENPVRLADTWLLSVNVDE